MLKIAIFDDVVAGRGETFHIPGLQVDVYPHADDATDLCLENGYDVVCMDFAMGHAHQRGDQAVISLRQSGFHGRIVAISSDPSANAAMQSAGADQALLQKAHLRSFLVQLSADHLNHQARSPVRYPPGDRAAHTAGGDSRRGEADEP